MDANLGSTVIQTIINVYRQQRRWGWGAENIPYLIFGFWQNKKIPLKTKLFWIFKITIFIIYQKKVLKSILYYSKEKIMDKQKKSKTLQIIIAILCLIILAGLFYFLIYPKIYNSIYAKGVRDGAFMLTQQINIDGKIPVMQNATDIQMIDIKTICQGIK
jgi:hypothetical protein